MIDGPDEFDLRIAQLQAEIDRVREAQRRHRTAQARLAQQLPSVARMSLAFRLACGGVTHWMAPRAVAREAGQTALHGHWAWETWCGFASQLPPPVLGFGDCSGDPDDVTCKACRRWIARGGPRDPHGLVIMPPRAELRVVRDGDGSDDA